MLVNNIKTLIIHTILAFTTYESLIWLNRNDIVLNIYLMGFIVSIVYIVCGVTLMNFTIKYTFLSVISVMIVLEIVAIGCLMSDVPEAFLAYLPLNSVYTEIWVAIGADKYTVLGISTIPSLLLYLGILLRRLFYRKHTTRCRKGV